MSLLLDALKKAEAEKRRRSSPFGGREPEPAPRAAAAAAPAPTPQDRVELALEELGPAPGTADPVREAAAEPTDAGRAAAESLFAAKEGPPANRQRLLIVGAIAILLLAAGGGYYVWKETSQPSLATIPPGAVATAPVTAPPRVAPPAPAAPVPRNEPVMVIESRGGERPPASEPPPQRAEKAPEPAAVPPEPPLAEAPRAAPAIRISRGRSEAVLNPSVAAGYESLRRGDLKAAETNYRAALAADRGNRDALLGLAAVAAQGGQRAEAERYYRAALALNPRDPLAVAGLLGVLGPTGSTAVESQLRTLLADQPDAGFLHYALGNHLAGQQRWAEAQQAYFNALRTDPANPDFAFNLAVALDQLSQSRLAAEYYRKALALAEKSPAAFDRAAAANRLRELGT